MLFEVLHTYRKFRRESPRHSMIPTMRPVSPKIFSWLSRLIKPRKRPRIGKLKRISFRRIMMQ